MLKLAATLACTLLFAGCTTLGKPYQSLKEQIDAPPSAGSSRLVFLRTKEHQLYEGRAAGVDLDDKEIGAVAYGGFFFHDIAPGTHKLKTEMWDMVGKCVVGLNAEAGATYYFMVDARTESFWAGMAGGAIGNAIEGSGKECSGAFKLYPVDPETAKTKIATLRYSGKLE